MSSGRTQASNCSAVTYPKPSAASRSVRVLVVRRLGDPRRLLVADVRAERGDEHQRAAQMPADDGEVGLEAARAEALEGAHGVRQQARRLEQVVQHHRLVDVELEVALGAGERHGGVVAVHLHRDLGERLGLRGVDLARHDRRARLVLGDAQLADPASGPRGVEPHVVGDLHQVAGQGAQGGAGVDDCVVCGERREEVGGRPEGPAAELADVTRGHLGEPHVRVHAGAHGGAAQRELVQRRQRSPDRDQRLIKLRHPAADHLPQRERCGILQVGAADHDDAGVLQRLGVERVAQGGDGRDQHVLELLHRGDVHDRGEGVVAGLPEVDVVVGVDRPAGAPARRRPARRRDWR